MAGLVNNDLRNVGDIDLFFTKPAKASDTLDQTVRRLLRAGYVAEKDTQSLVCPYSSGLYRGKKLDEEAFLQFAPAPGDILLDDTESQLHVQCVKIAWFDDVEHVVDSFDFTAIQFAIDVEKSELVFNPVSPLDYAQRRLVIHNRESDRRLGKRIEKYVLKGFRPCGFTYPPAEAAA